VNGGGTFNYGQSCTLTATPAANYNLVNWTKNGQQVSTNATYTFTVTESAAYVAHFELQSFNITVSANPMEGGTVTGDGIYTYGQTCTVSAITNEGYDFVNWTENGNVVSTNADYSFVVNTGRDLVANFESQPVDIKINIDPADAAQVTGEGTYHYGDLVTLEVIPNENYQFVSWTEEGEVVCEETTYTFIATTSRTLTANLINTEGVGEQGNTIVIYPNPVSDKLTIEAAEAIGSVEVYNLVGVLIYSQKECFNKLEISTLNLPSGLYFIRLSTNKGVEMRRFIKE
jgi:hypothetical protein